MVLLFIVIIVIVIAVYATTSKDTTPKKGSMQENKIKLELYQEVDNITWECVDKETAEFDSHLYFENRFIYESCGYPEVVEYMKKNLRDIGGYQIMILNGILEVSDANWILCELRKREEKIILNLIWVCGGGENNNCPQYIIEYRKQLYGLIRGEIPCTKENTKKIVEDYNRAAHKTK